MVDHIMHTPKELVEFAVEKGQDLPRRLYDVPDSEVLPVESNHAMRAGRKGRMGRTSMEQSMDEINVEHLYVRGYTIQAIANKLQMSYGTIRSHTGDIMARWKEETVFDFNSAIAMQLQKLDQLEMHAWEEFTSSRQITEVEKESTKGQDGEVDHKSSTTRRKRIRMAGQVRFLELIERVIEQRCKILGLHAPKEIAITNHAKEQDELIELTKEQLTRIAMQHNSIQAEFKDAENANLLTEGKDNE